MVVLRAAVLVAALVTLGLPVSNSAVVEDVVQVFAENDAAVYRKHDSGNKLSFRSSSSKQSSKGLLVNHKGLVLPRVQVFQLYIGTSWTSDAGLASVPDTLGQMYKSSTPTPYMTQLTQYVGVGLNVSYVGATVNATSAQALKNKYCYKCCNRGTCGSCCAGPDDSLAYNMLTAACRVLEAHGLRGDNYYVPVYTDLDGSSSSFCAFHMAATCRFHDNSTHLINGGFFWDFRSLNGCQVRNALDHSSVEAALVAVSLHELSEVMTDPLGSAWFTDDIYGDEVADLCEQYSGNVTLADNSTWNVHPLYSNLNGNCTYGSCAPGCAPRMLGNHACDAACNNAACNFDQGDCAHRPSTTRRRSRRG